MSRQSFTLKLTAIGGDVLLEIPRNHPASLNFRVLKSLYNSFHEQIKLTANVCFIAVEFKRGEYGHGAYFMVSKLKNL